MKGIIVSVADYGAVAGQQETQTKYFQKAIDDCFLAGGGEVLIPEGEFIIGDIRLRSNVTLHLLENAKLLGSLDIQDYMNIYHDRLEPLPEEQATKAKWYRSREWRQMGGGFKVHLYTAGSYWNYGMIRAVYAENISIIGEKGSVIDGRNVYDSNGEENYRGPHGINMHFCKNVRFQGYTIKNTGNWSHLIFQSKDIVFNDITVLAGHDALHTRACQNVLAENCKLITGDDAIAGFNNVDVVIRNCEISSACSAFRYGGTNVLIEKCNVYGPCKYQFRGSFSKEEKIARVSTSAVARNNMLCFYTNFVSDDLPLIKPIGNIVIRDCTVSGADEFLHLNLSGNENWQSGDPPTDITFENIIANDIKEGLYAYGNGNVLFELILNNVQYSARENYDQTAFIKAAYFSKIKLNHVKLLNYNYEAIVKSWSDGGTVEVNHLECDVVKYKIREQPQEPFVCKAI